VRCGFLLKTVFGEKKILVDPNVFFINKKKKMDKKFLDLYDHVLNLKITDLKGFFVCF
jgi:hypothetical protein